MRLEIEKKVDSLMQPLDADVLCVEEPSKEKFDAVQLCPATLRFRVGSELGPFYKKKRKKNDCSAAVQRGDVATGRAALYAASGAACHGGRRQGRQDTSRQFDA